MTNYRFNIEVRYTESENDEAMIQALYDLESLIEDRLLAVPGISDVKAETELIYED